MILTSDFIKLFLASCLSLGLPSSLAYRAGECVSVVMTRISVAANDTVTHYQCLRVPWDQVTDVEVEIWGTD